MAHGPEFKAGAIAHVSDPRSLFVLSTMMSGGQDEDEILRLAAAAVPALGRCRAHAGYLLCRGRLVCRLVGARAPADALAAQIAALAGGDGVVTLPDRPWAWAYALRSLGGCRGYLVVASDTEPPDDERFLLGVLARHTGTALTGAALSREHRQHARELRTVAQQPQASGGPAHEAAHLRGRTEVHLSPRPDLVGDLTTGSDEDPIARNEDPVARDEAPERDRHRPHRVGIHHLLAAGDANQEIEILVRDWLGALLDYDAGHHADLVKTLSAYLECGGNYDRAAQVLVIHRSTLRYRLRRIRQVSGLDLADVETRLNLHVATRAWTVLENLRVHRST